MSSRRAAVAFAAAVLVTLFVVSGAEAAPFPTLREQLRESKVIPGSALANLIRANQDFSMLRPEEAKDELLLPAWLRVLWRKSHPEGVYAAGDPTGGD